MKIEFVGTQPQYMSAGAAGADLSSSEVYFISAGKSEMIETNTAVAIPEGYFGMCCPRSSICNKKGLTLVNSVGVIDSDYTGTIKFVYKNNSDSMVIIEKGERIGQLLILPFVKANFIEVNQLGETERGTGGFGSTGK